MLRIRSFGIVALLIVVGLAGCKQMGKCSSCSKPTTSSDALSCPHVAPGSPPCASCAAHAAAPIPGPVER